MRTFKDELVTESLKLKVESDFDNGELLDTHIFGTIDLTICGGHKHEFLSKLNELTDSYRI